MLRWRVAGAQIRSNQSHERRSSRVLLPVGCPQAINFAHGLKRKPELTWVEAEEIVDRGQE
jgi:hypothetical protein